MNFVLFSLYTLEKNIFLEGKHLLPRPCFGEFHTRVPYFAAGGADWKGGKEMEERDRKEELLNPSHHSIIRKYSF